ncbi:PREDICTED: uncharacterized protein LOC106811960 [Priapulus caudatus]|uniref:Uncharacterized protein LOC106811960 n=1 Tax=Priapulus caudatus TaxID=37621 RepID=A0ABM1EG71_PRICU|nr:PREDICTED: uncharacterized protein LOC106811960 [Priapulus caudatus]
MASVFATPASGLMHDSSFLQLRCALRQDCVPSEVALPYILYDKQPSPTETASYFPGLSQKVIDEDMNLCTMFKEGAATSSSDLLTVLQEFYSKQVATLEKNRFMALVRDSQITGSEVAIHSYYNSKRQELIDKIVERLRVMSDSTVAQSILRRRRNLCPAATRVMETWFARNRDHPYPSKKERTLLAAAAGITQTQVKSWFANKRNRGQHKGTMSKFRKDKHQPSASAKSPSTGLTQSQCSPDGTYKPEQNLSSTQLGEPRTLPSVRHSRQGVSEVMEVVALQNSNPQLDHMGPGGKMRLQTIGLPQLPSSTYYRPGGMARQPLPSELLPLSPLVLNGHFFRT